MAWRGLSYLLFFVVTIHSVTSCGYPGSPSHAAVTFTPDFIRPGTVATYECEPGFELLGPSRRLCSSNGTWTPAGIPFCVLNVAAGKAPMQSSVAGGGVPERAVDGSTSNFFTPETCSLTEVERAPWWYVNLLEPYMVQLVRLDFGKPCCEDGKPATIVVRVGNSRPDMGVNAICNRFTGFIEEGRPLFLPCNPPMAGAFVSVHLEGPSGNSLSICETFVYTDQALPIERCPQFRDQEPGSSATYNGKCYLFHDNQPLNFNEARQFCEARGGSLIDETNPALQGFVSWELWRRHSSRNDPSGQYWLGLMRDSSDRSNWKWLSGKDVSVSFWNLPGGNENCARYDGTKGWLWSDTNCNRKLFFICQHRPKSCGRPEQPANGTIVADNFNVGNRVEYRCDSGHMVVGPTARTCLSSGFFSDYPPVCKYVQCGMPARIANGAYKLVNDTRHYLSMVSYACNEGYQIIGRGDLICDVDGRWNGPPPRCEPVYCLEPPIINNGGFRLSTNSTIAGTIVEYYCLTNSRYRMSGPSRIMCQSDGHYDRDPPVCVENVEDDEELRQPEKNVVPVDRKSDITNPQSQETEYFDDEYEYDDSELDHDGFIPPEFASKFNPPISIDNFNTSTTTSSIITKHVSTTSSTSNPSTSSTTTAAPTTKSTTTAAAKTTKADGAVRSKDTSMPTVPTRRPFTTAANPTRLTKPYNNRPTGTNSRAGTFQNDRAKPDVALNNPNGPVYLSPQDNEIADSSNVKNNVPPNVNEPQNKIESDGQDGFVPKLNLGGIIALGVFGGFVFLSAIITTFVIVVRRIRNDRRYRRRGAASETQTAATFDSSSVEGGAGGAGGGAGLGKSYRQAWDNLRDPADQKRSKSHHHHHGQSSRKETLNDPSYRTRHSEVMRDEGEMVVSEVYPKSGGKHHHGEKKRHHHHHHHKHSKRNAGNDW